ncbi:response regulator [Sulfitobacter sediminilitoris]|uniref:response regulator n=1 Tax=Sulfitobacter sediminilitoris TaxID=2698830 RepID=UPI003607A297
MLHATSTPSSFPTAMPLPREIRALLLDDSNFDRARIRRLSKKTNLAVQLDEVDSIAQLDEAVERENYDLFLIDYRLPVGNGMEALDHVLKNDLNRDAGKIMITGDSASTTIVEAMRGGCHDFLTKEEMSVEALRTAMINALNAAKKRQQLSLHEPQQKEIIRQGLVAAMQDSEVQGNVISLVRQELRQSDRFGAELRNRSNAADMYALLAAFRDEDDFIFH